MVGLGISLTLLVVAVVFAAVATVQVCRLKKRLRQFVAPVSKEGGGLNGMFDRRADRQALYVYDVIVMSYVRHAAVCVTETWERHNVMSIWHVTLTA